MIDADVYSRDWLQSFKNEIYDIGVRMGTSYYRFGGMMKGYLRRVFGDALVHVLVVPTENRQLGALRITTSILLGELAPARRQEHDRTRRLQRIDGLEERLRLHHHPRSAAIRHVVDAAVAVGRVLAQVVDGDLDQAGRARPPFAAAGMIAAAAAVVTIALLGALPTWPHGRSWGYGPSGAVGLLLVILVVLFVTGRL